MGVASAIEGGGIIAILIDAFMPVFYVSLVAALILGVAVYLGRND